MKHPLKFVSALLLLPQVALAQAPDTHPSPVSIICDGSYGGHLQGLATDGAALFWSHTVQLVKTDLNGKKLQRIDVASHHGDLTYHDGKVFVAVELGQFNQSPGKSDPWVYVYDADDLKLMEKHRLPELVHGCGGIAYHNGKFAVVGGLPGNHQENYIYEYDEQFRFVDRHLLPSGQTKLGIQTAAHIDGHWWFGCYGSPANPGLLKVDEDFKLVGHSATDFSFGIVRLNADTVLRGECFDKSKRGKAELLVGASPKVQSTAALGRPPIEVADGFEVSVAAASPLVGYPMMACLDDRGRLYIAESDGRNLTTKAEIEKELPRFVRQLEDVDGDGIYDRSTIFADKMTMPEGGLWHDGQIYIISAPYLWRLEDTDDDGVADKREKILGYMEFDGRANQHGPYFGPNGRLYFTGGHFGYDLVGTDGSRSGKSRAAGVFSCWPDGSDVRVEGQGGINPVDIAFTNNGEMLSTCAIFDSFGGRHDALIHWIRGGLTQRVYGVPLVPETGFRLPAVSRWGQVAPAGLARYRSTHFGNEFKDALFACHFNTQKLVQVRLVAHGATFATHERDFLTSTSIDFHPADVLEDADGSLLLLDTGGWLSWGCPHSQIAKPQIKGAIYRIRRKGGDTIPDPRGLQIDWERMGPAALAHQLADLRPAVRDRASEMLVRRGAAAAAAAVVAAFLIETADGRSHAGLIQRESPDAVYLRNADQREQRVPRTEITKMLRTPVSAMPQGLEQIFTPDELADLIAFLESCR